MTHESANYLEIISDITGISEPDILSKSRDHRLVEARQFCMYFCKPQIGMSRTGRLLGRNHSTVQHGFHVISGLIEVGDKRTVELISQIKNLAENENN